MSAGVGNYPNPSFCKFYSTLTNKQVMIIVFKWLILLLRCQEIMFKETQLNRSREIGPKMFSYTTPHPTTPPSQMTW